MNKYIVLICFVQIPLLLFSQNKLQFIGERIDFDISKSHFSTNGVYFFTNSTRNEINQDIFFPFGDGADSIEIQRVYDLSKSINLRYQLYNKGVAFNVNVISSDTLELNIKYFQKTKIENIYVLKSTQAWGRALQTAKYSLTVDKSVQVESISLIPDKMIRNVYYWDKKIFFPNEDLKIKIRFIDNNR